MPYTMAYSFGAPAGAALEAAVLDDAGTPVGPAITTGFVGVGSGLWGWTGSIPDGHRGFLVIRVQGGGTPYAIFAVNPEEGERVDAAVSSRLPAASYSPAPSASAIWSHGTRTLTAASDSSGVTTLVGRLTATRATNLDRLDATVSSRLASTAYAAAPSASAVASQVRTELETELGRIDAAVSSRSTLDAAGVWAHASRTVTVGGYASGLSPAEQVDLSGVSTFDPAADPVTIDLDQVVPFADISAKSTQTLADCLSAARADGAGRMALAGTTLTLYGPDGSTVVRSFTLDDDQSPTSRS